MDSCTTNGNAAGMDYVPDTPVCQTCGMCEARLLLEGDRVAAVLLGPKGIRGVYESLVDAEAAREEMGEGYYLLRRHIPEALKSYNLVDGGDIPL